MNANEEMSEKFTIKKAGKLRPKIIIYDVKDSMEDEEILGAIEKQNEVLKDSKPKMEYKMKTQRGTNVIMSLEPQQFMMLIWVGRDLGYESTMRCFNCQMYGHLSKVCRSKERSFKCGSEEHKAGKN